MFVIKYMLGLFIVVGLCSNTIIVGAENPLPIKLEYRMFQAAENSADETITLISKESYIRVENIAETVCVSMCKRLVCAILAQYLLVSIYNILLR